MTSMDRIDGRAVASVKGAPEQVLPRCTSVLAGDGNAGPLDGTALAAVRVEADRLAAAGLRVLAVARRDLGPVNPGGPPPEREDTDRDLCLVGLVGPEDPPRQGVAEAVDACHTAG